MKCKKQDNIWVSPLKQKGNLISDSKGKADILVEQSQSVFTKITDSIMGKSFMKARKSRGPSTLPCGTPEVTGEVSELEGTGNQLLSTYPMSQNL